MVPWGISFIEYNMSYKRNEYYIRQLNYLPFCLFADLKIWSSDVFDVEEVTCDCKYAYMELDR